MTDSPAHDILLIYLLKGAHMEEPKGFGEFVTFSNNLIKALDHAKEDIAKAALGNVAAAKRARVALVSLEKIGKLYRKSSMDYLAEDKSRRIDGPKKKR